MNTEYSTPNVLQKIEIELTEETSAAIWQHSIDSVQTVRINFAVSDPLPVVSGVPQGSILGRLLFPRKR